MKVRLYFFIKLFGSGFNTTSSTEGKQHKIWGCQVLDREIFVLRENFQPINGNKQLQKSLALAAMSASVERAEVVNTELALA